MPRTSLEKFVEKSRIFSLMDVAGVDRLSRVAVEVSFPAGTTIVEEGDEGDSFFCTIEGTLRVTAKDFSDNEKHLATLMAGSVFGEIAALSGELRTATVTTESEVRALKFEMVSVFAVLKDYPDVLAELNRLGIDRTEDLLTKVMDE